MKTLTTVLTALLLLTGGLRADDKVIEAAKVHLGAVLEADPKKLENSYAAEVVLMPGHEFLKLEYGLTKEPGRSKAATVERAKLIEAMKKSAGAPPRRPAEKIAALMESLEFSEVKTTPGAFAVPPDLRLQFTLQEGDILIKAAPPKRGDFVLLQMRQIDGAWRVVAEYLD